MPADGLTKALPRQKHEEFVRQLGMENAFIHQKLPKEKAIVGPDPDDLNRWY
jgi:hypothetical protein